MDERTQVIRLSMIWGAVLVLCFSALMYMAIVTSGPRGDHGRLSCVTNSNNEYEVTITCATGPAQSK